MKNLQSATKTPKVSVYYLYPQPPKFEPVLEALLFSDPLEALPLLMPSYTVIIIMRKEEQLNLRATYYDGEKDPIHPTSRPVTVKSLNGSIIHRLLE